MLRVNDIRKEEIQKAGIMSEKIRDRFREFGFETKANSIPTDLGDIYEICCIYQRSIDLLVSSVNEVEDVIEILKSLRDDLYIHLTYHQKSLKKPLTKLLDSLTEDEGAGR